MPGGLDWHAAMQWLEELVLRGHRIVGVDLCEVAPGPADPEGAGWDAVVGARLLYRLIGAATSSRVTGLLPRAQPRVKFQRLQAT